MCAEQARRAQALQIEQTERDRNWVCIQMLLSRTDLLPTHRQEDNMPLQVSRSSTATAPRLRNDSMRLPTKRNNAVVIIQRRNANMPLRVKHGRMPLQAKHS